MSNDVHNVHMLLPKRLWRRAKAQAILEATTLTNLVVEALERLLEEKKANDE